MIEQLQVARSYGNLVRRKNASPIQEHFNEATVRRHAQLEARPHFQLDRRFGDRVRLKA